MKGTLLQYLNEATKGKTISLLETMKEVFSKVLDKLPSRQL